MISSVQSVVPSASLWIFLLAEGHPLDRSVPVGEDTDQGSEDTDQGSEDTDQGREDTD